MKHFKMFRRLLTGVVLSSSLIPLNALAWGPLGHRIVAETATLIMQNNDPELGGFLSRHRFELGYYAFLPDSLFRHGEGKSIEPSTHFFDIDRVLKKTPTQDSRDEDLKTLAAVPVSYKKFAEKFPDTGSAPWRVEQFLKSTVQTLEPVKKLKGTYQSGWIDPDGAGRLFRSLVYLGLMAHYTGDAAMPYHATSDFNGIKTGQKGIHFYFEGDCINALEPGLSTDVLAEALKNEKVWLKSWDAAKMTSIQLMFRVFYDSFLKISEVAKVDKESAVLAASSERVTRKKPKDGCPAFRPLLVEQLAKGSVLTAYLWSTVLHEKINFSEATELQFSDIDTSPKYPMPDYLN